MKRLFLLAAMAFVATVAAAQEMNTNENRIQVIGRAEKKVAPDEIYLKIVIKDNDIKGYSVRDIQHQMIKRLERLGIDVGKDLKVDDMSSAFQKRNKAVTTSSYQLKVTSAEQLADVYSTLELMGLSNITVIRSTHSQLDSLRSEVRVAAIRAARKNAEELAAAIGQKVGRAVYILDNGNSYVSGSNVYLARASASMKSEEGVADMSIPTLEFQDIELNYSVTVKFELLE